MSKIFKRNQIEKKNLFNLLYKIEDKMNIQTFYSFQNKIKIASRIDILKKIENEILNFDTYLKYQKTGNFTHNKIKIINSAKFTDFLNSKKYLSIFKNGIYSSFGDYIAINVYKGYVVYGSSYMSSSEMQFTFYSDDNTAIVKTHEKIMEEFEGKITKILGNLLAF